MAKIRRRFGRKVVNLRSLFTDIVSKCPRVILQAKLGTMNFDSFFSDVISTVVGGSLLTVIFFAAKEKIFPLPNISGPWNMRLTTESSSYHPYFGMILIYEIIMWNDGSRVYGAVEKVHEKSATGERYFVGKNRTRGVIEGCIQKNYFSADKLLLHITEVGHGRASSTFHTITIRPKSVMAGRFQSMVAEQIGTSEWQRGPFA